MAFLLECIIHISFILLCIPQNIVKSTQGSCLQINSENGLPFFQGYAGDAGAPDRRIHHQHQAIIPSYKFNCCGNITEWGVDLNPDAGTAGTTFDFIFQIWRPSPHVNLTGCYSLVDDFITTSIKLNQFNRVAIVIPSPQYQLHFQPGDVLGFYVESRGPHSNDDNGVVLLTNGSHTSEMVWFASIGIAAQTSQSGSCPYPVGTTGVLNSSTHAAPVISVSVITTPCPHASFIATTSSFSPVYPTSTNVALIDQVYPSSTTPSTIHSNHNDPFSSSTILVMVISVTAAVVVILFTIMAMTLLYYNIKRLQNHISVPVSITDRDRHDSELHNTQTDNEETYEYPHVNTIPYMKFNSNPAYGKLNSTHGRLTENTTYAVVNSISPAIELKENEAYALSQLQK